MYVISSRIMTMITHSFLVNRKEETFTGAH